MNIQHLRYFEVIAYHQNISKASQQLLVSQPSLSNVLQQLENELGTPLFERNGRKIVLNSAGRAFLATTRDVLRMLDYSVSYLKHSDLLTGTLRICQHIGGSRVYEMIASFCAHFPDVQIKLYSADKLIGDPSLSSYDLVILPDYEVKDQPSLLICQRKSLYAILPVSHELANRKSVRLAELKDEYFCFFTPQGNNLEQAYDLCIKKGFTPKVRYVSDSVQHSIGFIQTGSCVTVTYDSNLNHFDMSNVVAVEIEDSPDVERDMYLCLSHENPPPLAQRFFDFVKEHCAITESDRQ